MAYQTGTAATPTALLTTLVTWLIGRGWTSHASAADGSGHRAHLSKGGVYANFRAISLEAAWPNNAPDAASGYGLGLYLGTGYSGAAAWHEQAGGPATTGVVNNGVGIMLPAGPFPAYHFFDDGADNILVMVQHTGGIFGCLGFGLKLSQDSHALSLPYFFGSTSGYNNTLPGTSPAQDYGTTAQNCTYPFATHEASNTVVRATGFVKVPSSIEPNNNNWISSGVGTTSSTGALGTRLVVPLVSHSLDAGTVDAVSPNWRTIPNLGRGVGQAYPRAQLMVLWLFAPNPITSRYQYLGAPPSIFGCDAVGNGWGANDTLTIAGLDYRVYPGVAVRYIP